MQILNDESDRFEFGKLQEIRKERLGLQRIPNRKPFRTISRDGTYAYHVGGHLEFYEIKIGGSARSCIRQALGQLMEYGFWPGAARPAKLFVVGEPSLDGKAEDYLQSLREEFKIPIYYRQVVI